MSRTITVSKEEDFTSWYTQLVNKCQLIKYYDVSGCYVLLPRSYQLWEQIKGFLDTEFKKRGIENAYFPLLITETNLQKEESHIDGFAAEVAWVTHAGDYREKKNELEIKLAIRPTSETSIYSIYPDLIQGRQDLPLKLNQWGNVLRWEFKDALPFIRSREFLMQEAHTCFETKEEALTEVHDIIGLYQQTYRKLLAVPTILGKKTEKEKFDGASETYTLEAFIPEIGRGIQACTAHYLGDNFSKMFGITFQDTDKENKYVHQNSWGFTTRSIGILLMMHSDKKGLVLPPNVAKWQCVIIPIYFKGKEDQVNAYIKEIEEELQGIEYHIDRRDMKPGWKYNEWERQGIPIRIEVGPRDVTKMNAILVKRNTGEKRIVHKENLQTELEKTLDEIQHELYDNAEERINLHVARPKDMKEFRKALFEQNCCLIPWCNRSSCEKTIKKSNGAKSISLPTEESYQIDLDKENSPQ
jgi:prolyl-tRNA synthetase